MSTRPRIALAGATPSADGWSTGTFIARSLFRRGVPVLVLGRGGKPEWEAEVKAGGGTFVKVDYADEDGLAKILEGVETVVSVVAVKDPSAIADAESALIRAAARAGVTWFLPSQYGADQENTPREKWSPIQQRKNANKELVEKLGMKWTLVVTGMFMDVLWSPLLGWDTSKDPATTTVIKGDGKLAAVALEDVGEFVASLVTDKDIAGQAANRSVRIIGDRFPVAHIAECFEKATGRKVAVTALDPADPAAVSMAFPRLLASGFYDIPEERWDAKMFPKVRASKLVEFAQKKFAA
ncbi:hypothetical protein DFJ74DRAFT_769347 [Hyaloraphidium curvatum]|nr:hypothetical protein DFJ74DRAFT_769347 [Hyaloraphidium curvatum]